MPRKTHFRWLKLLVARVMWTSNRHQFDYNRNVLQAIEQLRGELAAVVKRSELAEHTLKHSADLKRDYSEAIDKEVTALAARLTATYATDNALLEASLRSELAAVLFRLAQQDGELATAAADAATAAAAINDLRDRVDWLEAGDTRDDTVSPRRIGPRSTG